MNLRRVRLFGVKISMRENVGLTTNDARALVSGHLPKARAGFCPILLGNLTPDEINVIIEGCYAGAIRLVNHRSLSLSPRKRRHAQRSRDAAGTRRTKRKRKYGNEIPRTTQHNQRRRRTNLFVGERDENVKIL